MNNENFDNDYLLEYCVKEMMYEAITKSFRHNGIEGTEEIIKRDKNEKRRNLMLNGYKELLYKGKNKI